jgi:hypothetical protein
MMTFMNFSCPNKKDQTGLGNTAEIYVRAVHRIGFPGAADSGDRCRDRGEAGATTSIATATSIAIVTSADA